MTHPLQKPPTKSTKYQAKPGQPFDPEELSRLLQSHLATQKVRAEQRRSARAAKALADFAADERAAAAASKNASPSQENGYHHVPKVAAAAFARTATPDPLRKTHKLSQPALKSQMEQLAIDESTSPAVKTLKSPQALDQAIAEREALRKRNQFQDDPVMEAAAEVDAYREVYKPTQRSFMGEFSQLLPGHDKKTQRPLSTGDVLEDGGPLTLTRTTKRKSKPNAFDMSERNNWTQPDQPQVEPKSAKKEAATTVRRKPSSWILLGRRSPKLDKEKDEAVAGIGEAGSPPPEGSRSTKAASFLARFKRHPS